MPYGLGFELLKLQCVQRHEASGTETVDPHRDNGLQMSALSSRYTYQQDENSPALPISPAPVGINRPLRSKNVRSMRLRPRQVLCMKCKNRVEEKGKSQPKPPCVTRSSSGSASIPVRSIPIIPPSMNPEVALTKLDLRKRKLGDICAKYSPQHKAGMAKTSPVIKISFASPRGRGTVLKIPAKVQHSEDSLSVIDSEYKRMKKAMKRARSDDSPDSRRHHKKSKRSKHKTKKKKRHKETERESVKEASNSDFENTVQSSKEPEEHWPFKEYLDDKLSSELSSEVIHPDKYCGDNLSDKSLKESSQNVPLKGKLSRPFTLSVREERPTFESTSSGNSDHSSEYDGNSDCESEEGAPGEHLEHLDKPCDEADDDDRKIEPLMMRIRTQIVPQCSTEEGRLVSTGDVIWGKIHGFPWWPGRVTSISVSQRDGAMLSQTASVSWFGSSTMSIMPCSEIHPFLQDFELRYNKKKKGPYKTAIRQACNAAKVSTCAADHPLLED